MFQLFDVPLEIPVMVRGSVLRSDRFEGVDAILQGENGCMLLRFPFFHERGVEGWS